MFKFNRLLSIIAFLNIFMATITSASLPTSYDSTTFLQHSKQTSITTTKNSANANNDSISHKDFCSQKAPWIISFTNTLRSESWHTLRSAASKLKSNYSVLADRLMLSFKNETSVTSFNGAINAVKFLHLPNNTSFGSAYTYCSNGNSEGDFKVYFRALNFTFKRLNDSGLSATVGRFDFNNGTEWKGTDKTIEWIKSNRIAERLIGIPNWTMYQRSLNGVLLKLDKNRFLSAFSAFRPTAGTYSDQAGDIINDIKVLTLSQTYKLNNFLKNQEVQFFAYDYDDHRPIVAPRADNTVTGTKQTPRRSIDGIDVHVKTFGVSSVGVYKQAKSIIDTLLWVAIQRGHWYELSHRASAFVAEAGLQWTNVTYKPWLRVGLNQSSGDSDPNDGKHETFFAMLPSRKYSNCNAYTQMNLKDYLVQFSATPCKNANIRLDYHRLKLSDGADRWYSGGGAMSNTGPTNGFTARQSGGSTDLGTALELLISWNVRPAFKINIFSSKFKGGSVVASNFSDSKNQNFSYIELVNSF